jgi:predicted RNA-binding protein Jag
VSDRKYTLGEHGPKIEAFLEKIFGIAGWNLKVELAVGNDPHPEIENPDIVVRFSGRDVELLQENRAEALLALEHLTIEALRIPHDDHSLIRFDIDDMRLMRIEELRANALFAADQVREAHRPFRFNTMSSRERRLIHLVLRDQKDIRSESEGIEPRRNVVIYPADMPSSPRPSAPPPPRGRGGDRGGPGGGRGGPGGGRGGPGGGRGGDRGGRGDRRGGPGGGRGGDRGPRGGGDRGPRH